MINRSVLTGRLTRDPELKYTQSGKAVASFTLAVNRQFTDANGERQADFINCVIWSKSAETLANYTHKGSLIGVDGRIQTRSYENQQGNRVYVTELIADSFTFLESKSESQQSNNDYSNNQSNQNNQSSNKDPFSNNSGVDINDDDLPF
ncbi:single-stranded DNA-binding protein [Companilactobacillus mishanensis]|uniref:Single-stranded DNA-binding protein n=1 Tax=Companilactobacillus mishanensis TaxID=2486008 RepID=A0A5P0ZF12_9LACO|nr:single-stranded DNA-binding protein [Companilactobacillus mishanensis]MQS44265.1 single-stranded DNA-binding protein [Companilactobacillus mishanensis]MQS51632.1 single-stranded DNA-binding protein [Companilactobacillus mishanensis]